MAQVWTFNYTGAEQTFTPPVSGVYKIEVQGAQGGNSSSGGLGGLGALVSGDFTLEGGKPIYVMVGGQGKKVENGSVAGGWNGGGSIVNTSGSAASGGGSSDIRIGGMTLDKRIIVAAGGGGGGYERTKGGGGGTKYGEAGESWNTTWYGGAGAGPVYGGAASNTTTAVTATSGTIGQGGKGIGYSGGGGGGGGGYFGGGGSIISGGGGGSSYNLGSNQLGQNSYRAGNGLVTITLKSEPSLLLIQDGDIIKTYENNTWQNIEGGMNMPTVDEFKQHGMTDLSVIPESAWNQLESDNIKILVLTKDTSINSASVNVTAIPKRQLIMQETDMKFEKPIKSFTLTGTVQNESVLKIIASNDSGTTWKVFNGVSWSSVDINDLDDVKSKGMDIATFNGITQVAWKPFLSGMKLRLAYYLDLHAVTDTLLIDKLAYETVPVVSNSPKLHSIKIETNSLTIEGRLKELERINAINMAKLNFKSNALLKSEKYKMHDMVIDTCESDSMNIIASSGAGELKQELSFSNAVDLGSGKMSELNIALITNIKKVEVN
ncbi:glycine-rich protein [Bacillus thuringiensis]|nr:glycine-rich protein [Bacillus thuringiensis]PES55931.1 hypothetical protein CN499_05775 [Bacillus thuringiensis]